MVVTTSNFIRLSFLGTPGLNLGTIFSCLLVFDLIVCIYMSISNEDINSVLLLLLMKYQTL